MEYPADKTELYSLTLQAIEGRISESDFFRLEALLRDSSDARQIYADLNIMYAYLRKETLSFDVHMDHPEVSLFDKESLRLLAEYEKSAPTIDIPPEKPQRKLIEKVIYPPKEKRIMSKWGIGTLILSAAAMAFLILYIRFVPKSGVEVATLTDSVNARWADIDSSMQKGARLINSSDKLMLREGFAEFTFDNYTKAIIEAPAELQILADDRIGLNYGKLYVTVPVGAIGFSVYTQNAKIVDLGTEFGVKAETDGDTQLYVLKGKTSLIAGEETRRSSIQVAANCAKQVSGTTGTVSDIKYDQKIFAREIDSETNIVWRGENVELASIIAGGNGLSPVLNGPTLNPNTGEYETKPLVSRPYFTDYSYNPVPGNVFVDGVFVPEGGRGPVTITSQGHPFECPVTSGKINRNIAVFYKPYDEAPDMQPALFDGITYGSPDRPCVLLHSNIGITIDLDRIRQAYPGQTIHQLQTGYGLTWAERKGKADFFILVDGVLKHEDRELPSRENSQTATITLEPSDRFLTFIVTDSMQSSPSPEMAYELDFFYLLEPRLIFQ